MGSTVDTQSGGEKIETASPTPPTENDAGAQQEPQELLKGRQLWLVFSAFMTTFALVALDQTILSTALPTIASHFNAVSDLAWIASAYFLPQAGFMLFFGRALAIAPAKLVLLIAIGIFELGSLFCAVAPSVNFLIFGRAVAGLGGAGLWISIMTIIARVTTMTQRPLLMGVFGAVFAVASIVGPLLGGALSDHVSWRWCFYINLPIGGVALLAVIVFLPPLRQPSSGARQWLRLDWIGTFLSVAVVTTLLLPLQWGGNTKPWNDKSVIALLALFAVLLVVFLIWEYKQGPNAILPLNLFLERSFLGACIEIFFIGICFIVASFYLPFFYQIRGHSATRSGLDILPFMGSGVLATLIGGGVVTLTGNPWPFLFASPLLASVAFGLLYTVVQETRTGVIFGFQVMLGIGLGAAIQNPTIITQSIFANQESVLSQAISMVTFMQLVGNAIGLAAAGAVFHNQLISQLRVFASDISPETTEAVISSVKAIFLLPPDQMAQVIKAYVAAVDRVFLIGVPGATLASLAALLITRRRMVSKAADDGAHTSEKAGP